MKMLLKSHHYIHSIYTKKNEQITNVFNAHTMWIQFSGHGEHMRKSLELKDLQHKKMMAK